MILLAIGIYLVLNDFIWCGLACVIIALSENHKC